MLNELSTAMRDASICGLGQAASNPLTCVLKYFPDELSKPLGQFGDTMTDTKKPAGYGQENKGQPAPPAATTKTRQARRRAHRAG